MSSRRLQYTEYEPIPTGNYRAVCREAEFVEGQFGEQVQFQFELTDPGYEDRRLKAWASATFSSQSKLFKWARNVLGEGVTAAGFAPADLLDKRVQLVITEQYRDDGTAYNKIEDVRAVPTRKAEPADEAIAF